MNEKQFLEKIEKLKSDHEQKKNLEKEKMRKIEEEEERIVKLYE